MEREKTQNYQLPFVCDNRRAAGRFRSSNFRVEYLGRNHGSGRRHDGRRQQMGGADTERYVHSEHAAGDRGETAHDDGVHLRGRHVG